jgi:Zn-dependent protease
MLFSLLSSPWTVLISVFALLVAITVHEFAHAWMAEYLGDPTARLAGRLTLNPLAHLDPIGSIALLLIGFGWGKPVPFDPYNLANPRRDGALISLAGPASNLILATVTATLLRFLPLPAIIASFIQTLVYWSTVLAIFNLIPIHPLDGGKVLIGLLPPNLATRWDEVLNQYGTLFLLMLIFPFGSHSLASLIISPIINAALKLLLPGAGFI